MFARQLGRNLQRGMPAAMPPELHPRAGSRSASLVPPGPDAERGRLERLRQQLRQLCWQVAGVERRSQLLGPALQQVRWQRRAQEHWPQLRQLRQLEPGTSLLVNRADQAGLRSQVDLQHRLVLAELLIEAALFRTESRGGHYRTDAPAPQPFWLRHTLQQCGQPINTGPIG